MPDNLHIVLLMGALFCAAADGSPAPWQERHTGVAIPMRDGKSLAADIYLPKRPGTYPTVLIQTPYGRQRFGSSMPDITSSDGLFSREHYAFVILDWRGFYDSTPAGEGVFLPRYGRDGYDAVEWIARQPWSNGRVGTWGPSALGRVQFMTAREQPPHLVCCVPLVAADAASYEEYYENGVYREAHLKLLDRLGFDSSRLAYGAPQSSAPRYRIAARTADPSRIRTPMLMITGWFERGLREQIGTFERLRREAGEAARPHLKMVVGPWHHTALGEAQQGALSFPGAAGERDRVSQRFLDYWLRGQKENGWESEAPFRWWQMGEERWLTAPAPSEVRTRARTFTLHANGTLDERPPAADEATRTYRSDPENPVPTIGGANVGHGTAGGMRLGPQDQRPLEARDDVLVYTSPVLAEPLRIFGEVTLRVSLAVDARDISLAARLCDVHPDGRSMLICDGITRARYREGTARAVPVEPGQVYTLTLALPPTGITLPAGHRLRLSLSGSNHPRFERNPHTGADHFDAATAVPAQGTLFHAADHPATLTVPVMEDPAP